MYDIAVSSPAGNPRKPQTWSRAPASIIEGLERLGYSVLGIDSSLDKCRRVVCRVLHQALGLGSDYQRGRIARCYSSQEVLRESRLHNWSILHTSTLDLPMRRMTRGVSHNLFCDSTWHLRCQYAADIDKYPVRMLRLAEQLEQESYAQIKHFFPSSKCVRDDLINHYHVSSQDITVVGTGRGGIEPYEGEKDWENGHILFVAQHRFEEKGGLLLLEAFKKAQTQKPRLKLVMVGGDEYTALVGNTPNVRMTGFVSNEELQGLFDTAVLFAMPALDEPWGLVYLEALACKTPILGLNRNSFPEISGHGKYGFIVDSPTPDCVADKIVQALSDVNKLCEMGSEGQRYCLKTFSWSSVATKIANRVLRSSTKERENDGSV
jgi:glycosyltransferase involved in cell wall biosynthesis